MMLDVASSLGHVKIISSKPIFFCDQMQGCNAENARIESESILALHCIVTRVNALGDVTQRDV